MFRRMKTSKVLSAITSFFLTVMSHKQINFSNDINERDPELGTKFKDKVYLKFTEVSKTTTAVIGEPLVLKCIANGVPQPRVYWVKNGGRYFEVIKNKVDDEAMDNILNDGMVSIQNGIIVAKIKVDCVAPSVAGLYECVADNGYRKIISEPVVIEVTQSEGLLPSCLQENVIGFAPHIFMYSDTRFEVVRGAVQLFCRSTGSPEPLVNWIDNTGNIIKSEDINYQILTNGDLVIKKVDWNLMGLFKCVASNTFGQDLAKVFLYPTALE